MHQVQDKRRQRSLRQLARAFVELHAGDILAVIAEGLPILVLVPEPALARWREVTGGGIAELPCEAGALRRWWQNRDAAQTRP